MKHLLYQKKKKSRLFIIFPDYISIFQVWNFKSFSRIKDSLRTLELSDCVLCIPFVRSGRLIECLPSMRKSNLKIRIAAVLIARNNH